MIFHAARKYGYRIRSIWTMLLGFDRPAQTVAIFIGRASPGPHPIRVRNSGLEFAARGPMDVWCLKETLLDRCYERYGFKLQPGWTIVDVGGGIGDFAVLAAHDAPRSRVLAFEPFHESFALLQHNVRRNQAANTELFEVAITGRPRTLTIDRSSGEPLMFEVDDADPATTDREKRLPVASATLLDMLRDNAIDRVDLLKLDCEGAEYDIIFNSPVHVLDRIQRIVMEYHDLVTTFSHLDLVRFLEAAGFTVETFPNAMHPDQIGYLRADR